MGPSTLHTQQGGALTRGQGARVISPQTGWLAPHLPDLPSPAPRWPGVGLFLVFNLCDDTRGPHCFGGLPPLAMSWIRAHFAPLLTSWAGPRGRSRAHAPHKFHVAHVAEAGQELLQECGNGSKNRRRPRSPPPDFVVSAGYKRCPSFQPPLSLNPNPSPQPPIAPYTNSIKSPPGPSLQLPR